MMQIVGYDLPLPNVGDGFLLRKGNDACLVWPDPLVGPATVS